MLDKIPDPNSFAPFSHEEMFSTQGEVKLEREDSEQAMEDLTVCLIKFQKPHVDFHTTKSSVSKWVSPPLLTVNHAAEDWCVICTEKCHDFEKKLPRTQQMAKKPPRKRLKNPKKESK